MRGAKWSWHLGMLKAAVLQRRALNTTQQDAPPPPPPRTYAWISAATSQRLLRQLGDYMDPFQRPLGRIMKVAQKATHWLTLCWL